MAEILNNWNLQYSAITEIKNIFLKWAFPGKTCSIVVHQPIKLPWAVVEMSALVLKVKGLEILLERGGLCCAESTIYHEWEKWSSQGQDAGLFLSSNLVNKDKFIVRHMILENFVVTVVLQTKFWLMIQSSSDM